MRRHASLNRADREDTAPVYMGDLAIANREWPPGCLRVEGTTVELLFRLARLNILREG